jgi:uncharacterized protein (DUF488 family)
MKHRKIWTVGHSTHSESAFIQMLRAYDIRCLVDVRRYPGSRRFPHFNKEQLESALSKNQIQYIHMEKLGGRRTPLPDSVNTGWRLASFRGYADYMSTSDFLDAVTALENIASQCNAAIMCSEAVWWSCHRGLVSDYLKWKGWTVLHIMTPNNAQEHPFTPPARVVDDKLTYSPENQLRF